MFRLKAALIPILIVMLVAFSVSAQEGETIHIVLPGENLFRISQDYNVAVDSIAQANNITNTWRIYAGQKLIIPSDATDITAVTLPETQPTLQAPVIAPTPTAPPVEHYTVTAGQSLAQIAENHGMSLDQIAKLNNINNPDLIYAGQDLIVEGSGDSSTTVDTAPVALPTSSVPGASNAVTHIVQPGETLASIAQRYGISWLQIAQANNIYDADHVEVGQELTIPGGSVLNADYSFISAPAAPPARLGVGKEIIVDLSDERTYAYEDGKLIRNVLSSTGLPGTPTVKGAFSVQRKYVSQTMTGPGYYLPGVPYIMYFYAGYALHGTYWHNNFGHPMSHGCVNLPTSEAEWFYNWTEIGTPVYVQS
ncbi:MAG: LysM peptidoglycan-binding domain-containing protein [Chloroflexota bacterium]